ncbi:hypothetical protein BCF33_2751 [Hasllibacter halocynthiae]|uniref:Uncharacterized protein n=1 Tax=Hasllibacter halocynthiae TaxID=595589 RepID=A0A2T0WZG1_9RHOB|nr:hypothetical protein [Hasllibacter halocynthiae]PRY92057.1 hypothetical protein BCF33_2751 [Hasllibacter halocynthiae]
MLGSYLIAVGAVLFDLWHGKAFEFADLLLPYTALFTVGVYYIGFLYGPLLLVAAYAARGRSFRSALAIRLLAFATPVLVLVAVGAHEVMTGAATDAAAGWSGMSAALHPLAIPLLAGLLSTITAEVALHVSPRRAAASDPPDR